MPSTAKALKTLEAGFVFVIILQVYALFSSIAAMELFSTLGFLFVLAHIAIRRPQLKELKLAPGLIGPDLFLGLFALSVIVSSLLRPTADFDQKLTLVMQLRWIVLLYSWKYMFSQKLEDIARPMLPYILLFLTSLGLYSFQQFFTGVDFVRPDFPADAPANFHRSRGLFNNTMTYSYSLGIAFSFILGICLSQLKQLPYKKWFYIALVALGISLVTTFTRGLWLSLFGVLFISLLFVRSKKVRLAVAAVPVLFLVVAFSLQPVRERLVSIVDMQHLSNSTRFQLWSFSFDIFKKNPIVGAGYRTNKENFLAYYENGTSLNGDVFGHSHNNVFELLSTTGLLGFGSITMAFLFFLYFAWRTSRELNRPALAALGLASVLAQIQFHMGGLTESTFNDTEIIHVLIFLFGLTCALNLYRQKPKNAS